jgi:hypothetical protein
VESRDGILVELPPGDGYPEALLEPDFFETA